MGHIPFEAYAPRTWPGTYRLPAGRLTVPAAAFTATLAAFGPYATGGLEAVCFWYGPRSDDDGSGIVAAVVVPAQLNHPRHYQVPAASIAAVSAATAHRGWRNLSQVHSHPGTVVEHSVYDDDHANSRCALSIVLPGYGRADTWPDATLAVHEFQDGAWHLLHQRDAAQRIIVDADGNCELVDLR